MIKRVFQDRVRLFAFLGSFFIAFTAMPAWSAGEICDTGLEGRLRDQLERNAVAYQDYLHQAIAPPADVDQIANGPCISKELERVTSQFSNAGAGLMSNPINMSGSASGILNKFFQAGFESLNETASFLPKMLDFQSQASAALGDLLGSLGNSMGFDSELCGMMVDMIVKYVQCQVPLEFPDLGNLNFSLNINLPDNCAGNVLRDSIYETANSRQFETLGQPITKPRNGPLVLGTAGYKSGN